MYKEIDNLIAAEAESKARAAHKALHLALEDAQELRRERNIAVQQALQHSSYRRLADALGVSRARIKQIARADTE